MKHVVKKRSAIAIMLSIMTAVTFGAGYGAMSMAAEPTFAGSTVTASDEEDVFAFENSKERETLRAEAEDFDDAFDLRAQGTVTPVKQQNPFGACWGFSAIAAAESSLLASGMAQPDDLDLSEKHLAYYAATYLDDPDSPQNGEGIHFKSPSGEATQKYDLGGIVTMGTSMFASGIGPVREDIADPQTGDSLWNILAYKGKKGTQVKRKKPLAYDDKGRVTEYGQPVPVWYSEDDDWSVPEEYRFLQSYKLKESYMLPNPTADPAVDIKDAEGVNAIKHQLQKEHRVVSVSYHSESFYPGDIPEDTKFMSDTWAQYTVDDYAAADHAVAIVGWDDNYPKENFREENQPPKDGAWLIRNSWGAETNETDDPMNNGYRHFGLLEGQDRVPYDPEAQAASNKSTGYFWISYYDKTLTVAEAFAFDGATSELERIEQTDTMPAVSIGRNSCDGSKMANVFQAKATEKLTDISVLTTTPGTTVSYQVYLLPDNFSSPEDGLLIEEDHESYEYGGYHLIALKNPTVLAKNQKYSVIVTETAPDSGDYVCFSAGFDSGTEELVPVVNPKESFYYRGGTWKDLSEGATLNEVSYGGPIDNFPIKAHLKAVTFGGDKIFTDYLTVSNWEEGTPGAYDLQVGRTKKLTAEFRGEGGDTPADWNPTIAWTSSDPDVASVKARENGSGDATITAVSEGKAYIKIDAGEWGVRLIGFDVHKPQVLWFYLESDQTEYTYTGEPIKPAIDPDRVTADGRGDEELETGLIEGTDYEVVYENNVNAGTGSVYIVGIGDYGGRTDPEEFTILKAPQTVTVPKTSYTKTAVSAAFGLGAKTSGDGVLKYSSGNTKAATVSANGKVTPKAPGTAKITIYAAAGDNYKKSAVKTVTVKLNKAANTLKVKGKTAAVEYKKVKNKAQSLKVSKVIKVTRKGQGKLSYAKTSGNKKITINKKTGKVTVKKGLKKGAYKVKVKVTASGNAKYKKAAKAVTFKVKVK